MEEDKNNNNNEDKGETYYIEPINGYLYYLKNIKNVNVENGGIKLLKEDESLLTNGELFPTMEGYIPHLSNYVTLIQMEHIVISRRYVKGIKRPKNVLFRKTFNVFMIPDLQNIDLSSSYALTGKDFFFYSHSGQMNFNPKQNGVLIKLNRGVALVSDPIHSHEYANPLMFFIYRFLTFYMHRAFRASDIKRHDYLESISKAQSDEERALIEEPDDFDPYVHVISFSGLSGDYLPLNPFDLLREMTQTVRQYYKTKARNGYKFLYYLTYLYCNVVLFRPILYNLPKGISKYDPFPLFNDYEEFITGDVGVSALGRIAAASGSLKVF
jgi:hypothetical protein